VGGAHRGPEGQGYSNDDGRVDGEFGRTPRINGNAARPLPERVERGARRGGIKGGQFYGRTTSRGTVEDKARACPTARDHLQGDRVVDLNASQPISNIEPADSVVEKASRSP